MTTRKAVPPVEYCVNCGQPAEWKTTNKGAEVAYFCFDCAGVVYPDPTSGHLAPV